MNLEKRKVLEMVRDGVISVEEGDQLLAILEENQKDEKKSRKIKAKIKAELERAKEDILKAKEKVKEEYEKIDFGKVKDRKSTRLNSSHVRISYAVFCL